MNYTPVIGMEIHVELKTNSKMFCGCKNDPFHAPKPNIYTCPVCLGLPGALPVPNKKAIEWTQKLGLALGSTIAEFSHFDRKHYFYPDLPKGYQISQLYHPLCNGGVVKSEAGEFALDHIHLEEDAGKNLHTTIGDRKVTLIDFNRSGVPLVEIVSKPVMHSAEEAKAYAKKIQQVVRALGISDADMEKGTMRLEANISLTTDLAVLPPYKVEVKNINSFRFLEQAINYEVSRQVALLDAGTTPDQETRGWNENRNETVSQRNKGNAVDYRYMFCPDQPPMTFSTDYIEKLRSELPKMPDVVYAEFVSAGMKPEYARLATESTNMIEFIESVLTVGAQKGMSANDVVAPIFNKKVDITGKTPEQVIADIQALKSVDAVSDDELASYIQTVISNEAKAVADYKAGKQQVIGYLMGCVMRTAGKKLDTKVVMEKLKTFLV